MNAYNVIRRPRVGFTLMLLKPVTYGPSDVVLSGYPQIYPHKPAERVGTIRRKTRAPPHRQETGKPDGHVAILQHLQQRDSRATSLPREAPMFPTREFSGIDHSHSIVNPAAMALWGRHFRLVAPRQYRQRYRKSGPALKGFRKTSPVNPHPLCFKSPGHQYLTTICKRDTVADTVRLV